MVATNLFGLQFEERFDIPKYHEDFLLEDLEGEATEEVVESPS